MFEIIGMTIVMAIMFVVAYYDEGEVSE